MNPLIFSPHRDELCEEQNEPKTLKTTLPEANSLSSYTSGESLARAYRVYYSCEDVGKFIPQSKRRIKWSFGLTNSAAARLGNHSMECRGEEHDIIFCMTYKPHKVKVKLYWNQSNITHLFPNSSKNSGKYEFAWQSRSGETFLVVAHSVPPPTEPQFHLSVCGVPFANLPRISEISLEQKNENSSDSSYILEDSTTQCVENLYDSGPESCLEILDVDSPGNFGYRLSIVGLNPDPAVEVIDELRSELYSSTLDKMRNYMKDYVPQTEEMVSRAIIDAFNSDSDSETTLDLATELHDSLDPIHIEVDAVQKACDWVRLNNIYVSTINMEERSLGFLQRVVNSVVRHMRHDRLSADSACRILLSVSLVLGIPAAKAISNDTLLFNGLQKDMTVDDLSNAFEAFGEISSIAISENWDFGICRFANVSSLAALRLQSKSQSISICKSKIHLVALTKFSDAANRTSWEIYSPESVPNDSCTYGTNKEKPSIIVTPEASMRIHRRGLVKNLSLNSEITTSTETGELSEYDVPIVTPTFTPSSLFSG